MKTIAIWNNKGGSGKTTTAYNTAYALGCELGRSVLLVDLDKQASLSHWFEHDPDTGETVADASLVQNRGIANVLVPGECGRRLEMEEAAFPTGWEGWASSLRPRRSPGTAATRSFPTTPGSP
ncbi:ParA family protein [Raoultibacter phocaeensis]|uniref:ParA family protein n=1 Tax=Raoultibacter phocaeensis TaxID=2479841 RepID=UPI00111A2372|nr:ParA family protein [Raoultibacter phocaeensis]